MKKLYVILFFLVVQLAASATVIRVKKGTPSSANFSNIQNAINAALAGDTLYIENSTSSFTTTSSLTLNKRLVIIGTGAYQTDASDLELDPPVLAPPLIHAPYDTNLYSRIGSQLTLNPGSEGTVLISLIFEGSVIINADSIQLVRCHLFDELRLNNNVSHIKLITSYFSQIEGANIFRQAYTSNLYATNCIVKNLVKLDSAGTNNLFKNCLFGVQALVNEYSRFRNCTFESCIFDRNGSDTIRLINCNGSDCIFSEFFTEFPDGTIPSSLYHQTVPDIFMNPPAQSFNGQGLTAGMQAQMPGAGLFQGDAPFKLGYPAPIPNIFRFQLLNNAIVQNNEIVLAAGANKTEVSQANISGLEFFIDTDPGMGLGIPIPILSGTIVEDTFHISINNLSPVLTNGQHTLNIRFKNTLGVWSHTATALFTNNNQVWYFDNDNDGYGNPLLSMSNATQPPGYVLDNTDCDDNDATKHQKFLFFVDVDQDGFGYPPTVQVCAVNAQTPPPGYASNALDCNDQNASMHEEFLFYFDADFDGYGAGPLVYTCAVDSFTPPPNYALNNTDCAPFDDLIHEPIRFFADADADGFGDVSADTFLCVYIAPIGFVSDSTDCQDNDANRFEQGLFYLDADGDGYGNPDSSQYFCVGLPATYPVNYVLNAGDCDDNDSSKHQLFPFYLDQDLDGFGSNFIVMQCAADGQSPPPGYATNALDCNDSSSFIYPGMILRGEYFFDTDPGFGMGYSLPLQLSSTDSIDMFSTISIPSNITKGMHKLLTRVQTCGGSWTHPNLIYIFVRSPFETSALQNAEFFIDADPGVGNGTPVSLSAISDSVLDLTSFPIPVGLTTGFHLLHIRVQNTAGVWSLFAFRTIRITEPEVYTGIDAAEYFIDTDPGIGMGQAIPIAQLYDTLQLFSALPIPGNLTAGPHTLNVRVRNQSGVWSPFSSRTIWVNLPAVLSPLIAGEYFFDSDPGPGQGYGFTVLPGDSIVELISLQIPSTLPLGVHKVGIRLRNQQLVWSHFETADIQIILPALASLDLKLMLQGYFNGISGMQSVLFNQGQTVQSQLTDTVEVSLRAQTPPFTASATSTCIVSLSGQSTVLFPASVIGIPHYVVVNHRNHLETWSANPLTLSTNSTFDFTTAITQAYGANQVEVSPGIWALYSGDINQDGVVDGLDYNDWESDNNNFAAGYFSSDLNGDGIVDGLDFLLWEVNNNNFVGVVSP